MAVTNFTSLLGLALPTTGDLAGTWGDVVNTSITTLLDTSVAGTTTISTDGDVTLTSTDGATNQARSAVILWTATGTATRTITAPAQSKAYIVINATGGTQSIVIRGAGPTTGVTLLAGEKALVAWNGADFVDLAGAPIAQCFKLYPWEWLWHEEFGQHLARETTRFIEPTWKMLLSNKGLLPILWELFPGHPNLLPAYEAPEPLGQNFVKKPKLSREGANVSLVQNGDICEEVGGDYGAEGYVYQALAPSPDFAGNHPVFGVWVVDHAAAGLGIREDTRRITGNLSRFVPHYFN